MYLVGTQSPITILNAITIDAFKKFLSNLKWMVQFFHFNHFIDIVWKLIMIMGKAKGQLTIWDAWKKKCCSFHALSQNLCGWGGCGGS